MNEQMSDLPQAETADPDGVQVALRAAQTLWSRGETSESLKWLRKAAESASDEGADLRSLQLAKAAAELRGKLFGGGERSAGRDISGAHPIPDQHAAQSPRASSRSDAEGGSRSSFPPEPADAALAAGEHGSSYSSRPVTATQYPSHRPRQRIGLTSVPGTPVPPREAMYASRESAAYAAVPSWSADAERRVSSAPPPLPFVAIDDYEELEAEPDDEPSEDAGSVWSSSGESWRAPDGGVESALAQPAAVARAAVPSQPAQAQTPVAPTAAPGSNSTGSNSTGSNSTSSNSASNTAASSVGASGAAIPPPLPPREAFSDDEGDFGLSQEAATVVIPPPDEGEPSIGREARWMLSGDAWDRESRPPGWDQDPSASWSAELRSSGWSGLQGTAPGAPSGDGLGVGLEPPAVESPSVEPPPPSETAPARLTARVHHQAVRVSFAPDLRVPGQYMVRPLREGEKAAAGERVALLVALEPGIPLV